MSEPPKEIPHGYTCVYIPDNISATRTGQLVGTGASGADAKKQAWLAKYATGLLALLKYPFYPLFILDNGMNSISKSLTVLTPA